MIIVKGMLSTESLSYIQEHVKDFLGSSDEGAGNAVISDSEDKENDESDENYESDEFMVTPIQKFNPTIVRWSFYFMFYSCVMLLCWFFLLAFIVP